MANIAQIPQNILTVDISQIPILFKPTVDRIVARSNCGVVILFIDNRCVELTTVVAHNTGMIIARAIPTLEKSEMIVLTINGEKLELLKPVASKLSTALLRKADDADNWQLANHKSNHKRRVIK